MLIKKTKNTPSVLHILYFQFYERPCMCWSRYKQIPVLTIIDCAISLFQPRIKILFLSTMNTLFSSKILFPCFLFFFVSLDCISCTDKMLYQDGLENYFQLALPAVVGPESIAFDCNGKGPYVSVSDGRILKWQGAKLGWIEFSVSSPQRQDLKPLTYIYMHLQFILFSIFLFTYTT